MTTSDRALPHPISPPAYAIASAIAMSFAASGNGNDVFAVVMLIGSLVAVVFSTRFTVRTYRRLSQQQEFSRQQILRYLGVLLALAVNGIVAFMVTAYMAIVLGVLLTGRGMVG